MGIISRNRAEETKKSNIALVQLSREEITLLLQLIKNSNFGGNMIDSMYHLTAKLQKEYIKGE